MNIAWYSKKQETPRVKLMDENGKTIKIFKGTQDVDKAESFTQDEETVTLYPNKATITGLKENTTYKLLTGDYYTILYGILLQL